MKSKIFSLSALFILLVSLHGMAQDILVVNISGKVMIYGESEKFSMAKPLLLSMRVQPHQEILISPNSSVRLLNSNGDQCEIIEAGAYPVRNLVFTPAENSTILGKVSDYMVSFFGSHGSSEHKESYKNSIFGFARGEESKPILNFPFEGLVSTDNNFLDFEWIHPCDTCQFTLEIRDMTSKKLLFRKSVSEQHYTMARTSKIFVPGEKYIWNVTLNRDTTCVSDYSTFRISAKNDFVLKVKKIEKDIKADNIDKKSIVHPLIIMAAMEQLRLDNYAIQYAKLHKMKYHNDFLLNEYTDRYYHKKLMKSLE